MHSDPAPGTWHLELDSTALKPNANRDTIGPAKVERHSLQGAASGGPASTDDALAVLQRRVTSIVEALPEAFVQLDRHWRYSYVNAAAERFLERSRQDLLGRGILDVYPQAAGTPEYAALRRAMEDGTAVFTEGTSPVTGGPIEIRAYPCDGGLAIHFQEIASRKQARRQSWRRLRTRSLAGRSRDITGRKQVLTELRRQATLLNLAPVAILVCDLDRRITYWNGAAEKTYGRTAREVLGCVSHEVLRTEFPVPRDAIEAEVFQQGTWEGELRQQRPDGDEVIVLSRWSVEYDPEGRAVGVLHIDRDITERKRDELALHRLFVREQVAREEAETARRRHAVLATLSEQLAATVDPDMILAGTARMVVPELADWCIVDVLGSDGTIQIANVVHRDPATEPVLRELRRGYPPHRHTQSEVLRTRPSKLDEQLSDHWRITASAERRRLLDRLHRHSSICVPLIARGTVLGTMTFATSTPGRVYGASDLLLAEDIARRCALALDHARLHEQLEQTMRLRESFLASVAHDLKNPLNVIQGFTNLLERRGGTLAEHPAILTEALETIAKSATAMGELVDLLQDIGSLDAGRPIRLERSPTDLVGLAREAASMQGRATKRPIRVIADAPELVGVWDKVRLRRILDNLLSNALKYSPDGSEILIEINGYATTAELRVHDRGVGIPPEDLARLFERFHRGRNVADRVTGSGLGLWGVRRLTEEHGGTITIDSVINDGTTATVRLPVEPPAEESGRSVA